MTRTLAAIRTRRDRGWPNQRLTPRFHLDAAVEVRDLDSDVALVGQIRIYGCYVTVAKFLPRGTRFSISRDGSKSASRRSCFCLRGSAARISAG